MLKAITNGTVRMSRSRNNSPEFGGLLRRTRHAAGMTQEQLAERAGVSARGISDLERGARRTPQRTTLDLLADALDLTDTDRANWEVARQASTRKAAPSFALSSRSPASTVRPGGDLQFITGREFERRQLHTCLINALRGYGSLVLISGEAGIGKTALVDELIHEANHQDCLVLSGGCYDLTTTPPYGPWTEALGAYPDHDGLPAVPRWFQETGLDLGAESQTALFEVTQGFFQSVAEQQALLVVIEDLHWSDPASLELLRYLGRVCADLPILIIVTYRDDELTRQHPLFQLLPSLVRETDAMRIELQPLTTEEIQGLLTYKGLPDKDISRLVAYLEQRAGGNPLFTTELLRALEIEGTLQVRPKHARLGELDETYLPALVLQVIERRLAHLDDDVRRALEIAAVIGQTVPIQIWEAVSGAGQEALDATIEQAFATHILGETSERNALSFTHALVREVLYAGIIPTRRRRWHRDAANVLIDMSHPDPDTVAFHLDQAGDPRLVDWLIRAGERAERRQALLMAADQFDRAQSLLDDDAARRPERAWLLFRTGLLLRFSDFDRSLQRLEEAGVAATSAGQTGIAHLARAHQGLVLCFKNNFLRGVEDMQAGIIGLKSLDTADRDLVNQQTASLGVHLGVQGRGTLAMQLALSGNFRDATAQLEHSSESDAEASPDAARAAGLIHAALGHPVRSRQSFNRSQRLYEALHDPGQAGVDAFWQLLTVQIPYAADHVQERQQLVRDAQALWARNTGVSWAEGLAKALWATESLLTGDWDEADDLLRLQQRDADFALSFFGHWKLWLALDRGDTETVWEAIRWHLPDGTSTEPGDRLYVVLAELQTLAIELTLDARELDEARRWIEAQGQLLSWSDAVVGRAEHQLLWARYHELEGDRAAARQHATRSFEHAKDPRQPLALLASHRFLGGLDALDGRFVDAERHLQTALALAEACAATFERGLALFELARLRGAEGNGDAAQVLLDEVRSICEPLKAQPTLDQVAELEAEIRDRPAETPFGLTPRELDVLRLVAEGLTDPEVAEQLFVSPRTVSSHLTSIYTKLNVSSRAAATRIAVEQRLL